jgi:hypothetical protein
MAAQSVLEEKHNLLRNGLNENLQKKHALELQISQQFEELKKLEIELEKCAQATTTKDYRTGGMPMSQTTMIVENGKCHKTH